MANPLTDEQSALAAKWIRYAVKRVRKVSRATTRPRTAQDEKLHDAAVSATISFARNFDASRGLSPVSLLSRRLSGEIAETFRRRSTDYRWDEPFASLEEIGVDDLAQAAPGGDDGGFEDIIKVLPHDQRAVLVASYRDGLSDRGAQDKLGLTPWKFRRMRDKALAKLRVLMGPASKPDVPPRCMAARPPKPRLTWDDVRSIRRMIRDGVAPKAVASRFGLALSTVSQIRNRKTWKHDPQATKNDAGTPEGRSGQTDPPQKPRVDRAAAALAVPPRLARGR